MSGSRGSFENRVSRDDRRGGRGGRNTLTIDSRAGKDNSGSQRRHGKQPRNRDGRNSKPIEPMNWLGKATDVMPVIVRGKTLKAIVLTDDMVFHWNKILSLSNKISDCSASEQRLDRGIKYIMGLYAEGPQKSPRGLTFRGRSVKEVQEDFEAEKAQLQKIKQMWAEFNQSLESATNELYGTMSKILGDAALLEKDEEWYEEHTALDPSRPKYEEDAEALANQPVAAEEVDLNDADAYLKDIGADELNYE